MALRLYYVPQSAIKLDLKGKTLTPVLGRLIFIRNPPLWPKTVHFDFVVQSLYRPFSFEHNDLKSKTFLETVHNGVCPALTLEFGQIFCSAGYREGSRCTYRYQIVAKASVSDWRTNQSVF